MTTLRQFIAELHRTKGEIYAPICTDNDVYHIRIVKSDLINALSIGDPASPTPFGLHFDSDNANWTLYTVSTDLY